jgi:hypothetical protein
MKFSAASAPVAARSPTGALALDCAAGALSTQSIGGSGYVLEPAGTLALTRDVAVRSAA